MGWRSPQFLPEPSSHSQVCLGLFFFFTQKSFQRFGVLPSLRLMDEEGASLLPLLQDCANPPLAGPMSVHQGFAGEAGSTPKTYRQSSRPSYSTTAGGL